MTMFVKGRREKDLEMSLKHCIFSCFLVVLFAISYNEVSGVQCYQCSSFIDPKCGTTWGFRGNEGDQYLHECDENASGCRKLQFEEERSGTTMVTRSCYNSTTDDADMSPAGCNEMYLGMSCYCVPKQGEKTCNGQSRVVPLYLHYIGLFVVLCLAYFKY